MMKQVSGLVGGLFVFAMGSAQATTLAWTSVETSMFVPTPNASRSAWTGNNLALSYDNGLVDGSLWEFSQSVGGTTVQFPSLWSSLTPLDIAGVSFDFSRSGDFDHAVISFEYYIPSAETGVGVNTSYQAIIEPPADWTPDVGGTGTQAPTLVLSELGDTTHVEFMFSLEMLQHLDGLIGIGFTSRGTTSGGTQDFSGSANFSNVSWLVSEGISDTYTRWHYADNADGNGDQGHPVPEPETYALLLAGVGLLSMMTRRRKQKAA